MSDLTEGQSGRLNGSTIPDEVGEIYETFRAWFAIQSQVRAFIIGAYCAAVGFAIDRNSPALLLLAAGVVGIAIAGEVRMRFYIAPFAYRGLCIVEPTSALGEFLRVTYTPALIARALSLRGASDRHRRLKWLFGREFLQRAAFTYYVAAACALFLFIYYILTAQPIASCSE